MTKETSSADPSLPLHEVLESEFVALHGELPANYPSSTNPETRLQAFFTAVHGLKEKRTALCISGGGIRSATFGLGVLQGLVRCGLLDRFHYLSTVSGGGYIGGWLSAWIKNHPEGVGGVVAELQHRPNSTLEPEPQPIRHLREFSNYLAPRSSLNSVDFWTLITTFIRNMFLNWLVLISCLAFAMMIPRLYLAAMTLQPDWSGLATSHSWQVLANNSAPDWNAWEDSVKQPWDRGLTILLAVGFALIAVAMAYAIIDVPSTGNTRLSQGRFLKFRQLPLFLASLILAAWWAVFCNVHGDEPFRAKDWLLKFVAFFVLTYVCGGLLGTVVLSFRSKKARRGRFIPSLSRLGAILLTSAFGGFCLWAISTRMFLDPKKIEFTRDYEAVQIPSGQKKVIRQGTKGVLKQSIDGGDTIGTHQVLARIAEKIDALELSQPEFTLVRDCEATEISNGQKTRIPHGTKGVIKQTDAGSYTVKTDQGLASIAKKDLDAFELNLVPDPKTNLTKFTLKRDCEAIQISSRQKTTILQGTKGWIMETVEGSYTVETDQGRVARIAEKDLDALKLGQPGFALERDREATEISSGQKTPIPQGATGWIMETVEGSYTVETDQGLTASIAKKDIDALKLGQPKFALVRDCEATEISNGQKTTIPLGTKGVIKQTDAGSYTVETDQGLASIAKKDLDAFELNPVPDPITNLTEFTLKHDYEAIQIPSGQKTMIPHGTKGVIKQIVEGSDTVETDQGLARIAKKDFDAFDMNPVPAPAKDAVNYVCFAPALIMGVVMLVNFLFTGLTSWVTKDEDREWWGRSASWILITIVGWIVVNAIVLWGAQAITPEKGNKLVVFLGQVKANPEAKALLGAFGGVTGIVGALLVLRSKLSKKLGKQVGSQWPLIIATVVFFVLLAVVISWILLLIGSQSWLHQLVVLLGQVKANPEATALLGVVGAVTGIVGTLLALRSKPSKKLGTKVSSQWPLIIAAVGFFVFLAVVISRILLLIGWQPWVQTPNDWQAQLFVVFILTLVILLFGIVMGFFINANEFSLHATYRNRLIRAYLAASRTAGTRKPSLFTGFDPADNFALRELSPEKPLHVMNGALNLVKGEQLAWQERKAESFTMSRLHCGCLHVGYRPSAEYGAGITLGTAMAISGAAANPNMGYHSSPIVGFLMVLFNMRLGWWLGNPGSRGAKTWRRSGPGYSVGPLFSEAIGNTTDHYKYVNLSDGGHFENLGLYEMVLRRCYYVVVSDAGQDPECSFADLGEAVRKIRIDFGIPIEFGPMSIYPRSAINTLKTPGHICAIGRIRYSIVDGETAPDGVIVYIKPACYGDEPRDIYEYFKRNPMFPHESTADQFFSESQFESYRMLGAYMMEKLCTDCRGDFRCFIRDILKRHLKTEAPDWLARLLDTAQSENKV